MTSIANFKIAAPVFLAQIVLHLALYQVLGRRASAVLLMHPANDIMSHQTARALIQHGLKLPRRPDWKNLSPILCEELSAFVTEGSAVTMTDARSTTGYPTQPFAYRIADNLVEWARTGACPVLDMCMEGVEQITTVSHDLVPWRPATESLLVAPSPALPPSSSPPAIFCGVASCPCHDFTPTPHDAARCTCVHHRKQHVDLAALGPGGEAFEVELPPSLIASARDLLERMGPRAVALLLGMRHTQGSVPDALPPPRDLLLSAFNRPWSPPQKLTVGARALSKHAPRSVSSRFWGEVKGSEQEKNRHAEGVVLRLLDRAAWINVHDFTSGRVLEVRVPEGYGARWALGVYDAQQLQQAEDEGVAGGCVPGAWPILFRGFLEPQALDGHERGWVH